MKLQVAEEPKIEYSHDPRRFETTTNLTFVFRLSCEDDEEAKDAFQSLRERLATFETDFNNYYKNKKNCKIRESIQAPFEEIPQNPKESSENRTDPIDSLSFPE